MVCPKCGGKHGGTPCPEAGNALPRTLPPNAVPTAESARLTRRFIAFLLDAALLSAVAVPICLLLRGGNSAYIISYFICALYGIVLEASAKQAAVGGQLMNLRVLRAPERRAPLPRICLRNAIKYLPVLLCAVIPRELAGLILLILLSGVFFRDGRPLYDIAAGCSVMELRSCIKKLPADAIDAGQGEYKHGINCASGCFAGTFFPLSKSTLVLGRNPQECNIVFPQRTKGVSAVHCNLIWDESSGKVILRDLGSTYGTFVSDGTRLQPEQMAVLRDGDSFTIGGGNRFVVSIK